MRVSFLSPRLPPDVCGVADHTRLLAAAMVEEGAEVGFIHRLPRAGDGGLPRGPVAHWHGAASSLRQHVAAQDPDWLWVQLSNYGYSRWGAPFALVRALGGLGRPRPRVVVCLHETHCLPQQLGFKGPLLSPWQRHTVGAVARRADVVFATVPVYWRRVVEEYGVPAERVTLLPIGSNVPDPEWTESDRTLMRRGLGWADGELVAVTFGTYASQLRALSCFEALLTRGVAEGRLQRIICLGGDRQAPPPELVAWQQRVPSGVLHVMGPRPAEEVGRILACCDVALAPTPRPVLEKSGAFMAFAFAGLAVVVHSGGVYGNSQAPELPVFPAESWDWGQAASPAVAARRRALADHAQATYTWTAIARHALARMTSGDSERPVRAGAEVTPVC
jgi:hypothetical protein